MGLEDEAGVVVEVPREGGAKREAAEVDALGRHEAAAFVEEVERTVEVEAGVAGQGSQGA